MLTKKAFSKKHRIIVIVMYVLYALPIWPFFVASVFSLISFQPVVAAIGQASGSGQMLGQLCFLITMVLAAVYIITYIASLAVTIAKRKISVISFFPLFHVILVVVFFLLAEGLEKIYGAP